MILFQDTVSKRCSRMLLVAMLTFSKADFISQITHVVVVKVIAKNQTKRAGGGYFFFRLTKEFAQITPS